ncbi:hypothetical protein SAMN04489725_12515 [Alicyclobacillus hesperidum]|uniref:Uncharacterized protein n=1 Tax=Alicyclobacillus hesperidum TaxID=89784 RepID=A0A1H2XXJ7_9BACL|nr:hypothetical protein [Alicyclobacillus hesperidum]SDW97475.1 hypothetical protein SAMN04489725_12515 [Alicyclobacillus hesperidum]
MKQLTQLPKCAPCYNANTEVLVVEKKEFNKQPIILGDEFRFLLNEDDDIYDETFGHLFRPNERESRSDFPDEGSVQ